MHKDLIFNLVISNLRLKYRNSFLGFLWTFLDPLFLILILLLVFTKLFSYDLPNYPAYLLIGVFVWNYFSNATVKGLHTFLDYSKLINKTKFPRWILIFSNNLFELTDFIIKLIVLMVILLILKRVLNWPELIIISPVSFFIILVLFLQFIFTIGLSFILGSVYVYFRDISNIWGIILHIGFFLTPIFYPSSLIPERYNFLLSLNPMNHFINLYRKVFIEGILPINKSLIFTILYALIFLLFGILIFRLLEKNFAQEL